MTLLEIIEEIKSYNRESTISGSKKDIEQAFTEIFAEVKKNRLYRPQQTFIIESEDMVAYKPKAIERTPENLFKTLSQFANQKAINPIYRNPVIDCKFGVFGTDGAYYVAVNEKPNLSEALKSGFIDNESLHINSGKVIPFMDWQYDLDWLAENKMLACEFVPGCLNHAIVRFAKKVKLMEYNSQRYPFKDIGYANAIIRGFSFDADRLDRIVSAMFRMGAKRIACWKNKDFLMSPLELFGLDKTGKLVAQGALMEIVCGDEADTAGICGFKLF